MSKDFPKIGCIQHDCAACQRAAKTAAAKDALMKEMAEALDKSHAVLSGNDLNKMALSQALESAIKALAKYKEQS